MNFLMFMFMILLFAFNAIIAVTMFAESLKKGHKGGYRAGYALLGAVMVCNCIIVARGCYPW